MQSQGSHAYFPRVFSLSALSLLVAAALGLIAVISIRLILGSRRISATGIRSTFAILSVTQCAFFVSKETIEALAVQASPDFLSIVILAVCVQLPLAALAAWLIAWMRGYLEFAPDAIRAILAVRLAPPVGGVVLRTVPVPERRADLRELRWYCRRGPPSSS